MDNLFLRHLKHQDQSTEKIKKSFSPFSVYLVSNIPLMVNSVTIQSNQFQIKNEVSDWGLAYALSDLLK